MYFKKYSNPSNGQQVILYLRQFYHGIEQIQNICARIDILSDVNEEQILEAIFLTVMRVPSCRIRFHNDTSGNVVQYISEQFPTSVSFVDLSELSEDDISKRFEEWSKKSFDNILSDGELCDFRLVRTANNGHILYVRIHHLIMDSFALMSTVCYMGETYTALKEKREIPDPRPDDFELIQKSAKYFESPRFEKDRLFWTEEMRTEPTYTTINGDTKELVRGKKYAHALKPADLVGSLVSYKIPAKLVRKLNASSMEKRISPQAYYMLALRTYLARVNKTDDVIVISLIAHRSKIIEKQVGGTLVVFQPVRTCFEDSLSFDESLERVAKKCNDVFRHCDFPAGAAHGIAGENFSLPPGCFYYSTNMTYQPYLDFSSTDLKYSTQRLKTGYTSSILYIDIMPHDDSGDFYADYEYSLKRVKLESIESFHEFMLKYLDAGIDNPDKTVKDLVDLCL